MAIVAASGNGSAPSTAANRKNNGGTVLGGGAGDGVVVTRVLGVNEVADGFGRTFGSRVYSNDGTGANTTDRAGVSGIVSSVTVGYVASNTEWIMRGVTTTIGGASNSVLLSKSSDYNHAAASRDGIQQLVKTRTLGSGNSASFNMLARQSGIINPSFVKGSGAGNQQNFVKATDGTTAATDLAAATTRGVPGEITYHFGGLGLPSSGFYKAKDAFES